MKEKKEKWLSLMKNENGRERMKMEQ